MDLMAYVASLPATHPLMQKAIQDPRVQQAAAQKGINLQDPGAVQKLLAGQPTEVSEKRKNAASPIPSHEAERLLNLPVSDYAKQALKAYSAVSNMTE